jgi:hypothetical protein
MNDKFEGEQEDYLVSYYDRDGLLRSVADFGNEEEARYFADASAETLRRC